MVGQAPPPPNSGWRLGLYWTYVVLLSVGSIFYLAIVSPIIRPTLPTHPGHLLFCIIAGVAIADAAAHALSDIAGIWKPHDLGGAEKRRQKFNPRKLLVADTKRLISHLTAVPVVGLMAFAYTLLSPHIQARLFGATAGEGAVFLNFFSQTLLGGLEVFAFFLSHDARSTLRDHLHLAELVPASFEAAAILAGLKLYGLLITVSTLRLAGAPIVLLRTWMKENSRRKRAPAKSQPRKAAD
jgi:hypothetical protein